MPSKETLKMQARKMAEENGKKINDTTNRGSLPSPSGLSSRETKNIGQNEINFSQEEPTNFFQYESYQNWIHSWNSQPSNSINYLQQWAWMQQIYANYYWSQYLDM